MIGTLVRLKLALLRSGLAAVGIRGKVAFAVTYLFAVVVGLLGAVAFGALHWATDAQLADYAPLGLGLVFLVWTLGPVLAVASENTLEVDRLALYPLAPGQLMPGLLLGSMVGFGGLTTALALLGLIVGAAPASPAALVTVAATVLAFGVCVATSRVVSTALSAATRKRRWRDVALTAAPLLGFGMQLAVRVVTPGAGGEPSIPTKLFDLLPTGPSAIAVVAARQGRWTAAAAGLLLSGVVLVVLLRLWWLAVNRVLTTAVESGAAGGRRRGAPSVLFPGWPGGCPPPESAPWRPRSCACNGATPASGPASSPPPSWA